jgi:hypothetical protein
MLLEVLLGYSLLFSMIIHVSNKGHQQQPANIQNTFFECATMWDETELDNIVFSFPTPTPSSKSLYDEDEGMNHGVAPLHQPSLSIDDDDGNDLPQLEPQDHHNGGMPLLTQRTKTGVEGLLSMLGVIGMCNDGGCMVPQPAAASMMVTEQS